MNSSPKHKKIVIGLSIAIVVCFVLGLFIVRGVGQKGGMLALLGIGGPAGGGVSLHNGNGKADIPLIQFNPAPVPQSEIGKHPNILLVIADDMGVDADPCHPAIGGQKPTMPNLQAMCSQGVVFEDVWVNSVCSPTRATMMSGQYGFRTGVQDVDKILSPDTTSLADVLSDSTKVSVPYANAFIGKWHMSGPNADLNAPSALGVQYFAGFLAGGVRDYTDYYLDEQGKETRESTYTTTLFTNKAIAWIQDQEKKDANRPWFMWLAYNAPHAPFHMPPKELIQSESLKQLSGTDTDIKQHPLSYYLASLEALDTEIGRVLASLSPEDRANTVVLFVGDNGTPAETIQSPFTSDHAKTSVYEGGVRGVLVVSGAEVTRKGEKDTSLINGTDIYATILDVAGVASPNSLTKDSVSFKNAFKDSSFSASPLARNFLYTDWVPAKGPKRTFTALRDGQYKIIKSTQGPRAVETYEIYD
jgi:arylsulfatase A-like enzyme